MQSYGNCNKRTAEIIGANGLLEITKTPNKVSWAVCELYRQTPEILQRWNMEGWKKIYTLGQKMINGGACELRVDGCHGLFKYSPTIPNKLNLDFLEEKVNGMTEGWTRSGKLCRGCIDKYWEIGNISTYHAGACTAQWK